MRIDSSVAASSGLTRRPDHAGSVKTLGRGKPVAAKLSAPTTPGAATTAKANLAPSTKGATPVKLTPPPASRGGFNAVLPSAPAPAETSEAHGPSGGSTSGLTLEGLRREWGQSDSSYDLNSDKTVNVDDLIQFLLNYPSSPPVAQGTPDDLPAAAPPPAPNAEPAPPVTPQLAGDAAPIPVAAPPPTPTAEPVPLVPPQFAGDAAPIPVAEPAQPQSAVPTDPNMLLNGIRKSWGETGSAFDLNHDQTVNVDDLMHLLLNWPGSNAASLRQ